MGSSSPDSSDTRTIGLLIAEERNPLSNTTNPALPTRRRDQQHSISGLCCKDVISVIDCGRSSAAEEKYIVLPSVLNANTWAPS